MHEERTLHIPTPALDLHHLANQARRAVLGDSTELTEVGYVDQPWLARIDWQSNPITIYLHPILNFEDVPSELMLHIFIQLHVRVLIPPVEISPGIWEKYPPGFWEFVRIHSPDGPIAFLYLYEHFGKWIRRDQIRQALWVDTNWLRQKSRIRSSFLKMLSEAGIDEIPPEYQHWSAVSQDFFLRVSRQKQKSIQDLEL